ncbi:MAG: ribonuclease R [Bacteroidales bacterium]|nr:ribonuclease R [Bacteroidales bacterium]
MAKKKNKKGRASRTERFNKKVLTDQLMGIFTNDPSKTYNYKQISKILEVKDNETRKLITTVLHDLRGLGILEEVYTGKYKLKSKAGYIVGKVELAKGGYGFIISDDIKDDVFVAQNNLNHALHGDTVKVYLYAQKRGKHVEGEVVEILARARETFVGIIQISPKFAFLEPDDRFMPYDLFIPLEKLKGAKDGQKAIARIVEWPEKAKNPFGEIVEVLGNPGENDVEMHAILAEFELPYRFEEKVNEASEKLSDVITNEEIKKRRDFRGIPTFTIDPADAKDFDDALSIQKLENGHWEVGVHIADVTHYVKSGSMLDEEAFKRATSVYLVDRVVPMLPERISNYICSLRPNEDKLCFSAVFELDDHADIVNEWFGRTIIHSDRRFAYEQAQDVIETGKGDLKDEILQLHDLAQKLRKRRFDGGAVAFERIEVKFEIDEKGRPIDVFQREHKESNQLIEEFMLLANRRVAEFIGNVGKGKKGKTFVYRIHDRPNEEKMAGFSKFLMKFGYKIKQGNDQVLSESINNLLKEIQGKPEQNIIETLAIRSMAKAAYSTDNIGHYGLAFKFYTHFTSPIRRYPDMMVHRLLDLYLSDGESASAKNFEAKCKHSSEMERKAAEAERASIKYKQVEFMQDKVEQEFDGVISGVTEWGIYVELVENMVEGMVAVRDMLDDFYELDEDNYCIIGRRTRKKYQLGDPVKVQLIRADLARRLIDFEIIEE